MRAPLALLAVALLAGCFSAPAAEEIAPAPASVAVPRGDARATLDALGEFSAAFPYRQSGTETHLASRDWLEAALADAGLDTMRQPFESSLRGLAPVTYTGENVIGIKWGADRSRWVVVGSHYDITEGAVHGTYDDGSGTLLVVELAKAFANVDTNRTIAFVAFDQEERGLVGSRSFVESVVEGTFEHAITVDAMIDLDMVGITWPHPADLVAWVNSPSLQAYAEDARIALEVPDDHVQYREPKGGVSDGAAFIAAGIPTIYWWSNWDEVVLADGTEMPGSYPWWHQADTYDTMVAMAGDEATLEAGFQTVLDVAASVLARAASSEFVPDAEAPAE